ncbi:hypothetical protein WG66_005207 [Moniliophthora roreri]|nr:hypothetical protein WG66_005207 [Moniliophthora roreri]
MVWRADRILFDGRIFCPYEDVDSIIQTENIAAIILVLSAFLTLLSTIKWPTEGQLPFTLLILISRPIFCVIQIIRTLYMLDPFVNFGASESLQLIQPFETGEHIVSLLFFSGFVLYLCIALKYRIKLTPGKIWKPSVSAACFFAVEAATRAGRRSAPVSFVVITVLVVIGLVAMHRYYPLRRPATQAYSRTKFAVLDKARIIMQFLSSHLSNPLTVRGAEGQEQMPHSSQESGSPSSGIASPRRDAVSLDNIQGEHTTSPTVIAQISTRNGISNYDTITPLMPSFTSPSTRASTHDEVNDREATTPPAPSFTSLPPSASPSRAPSFTDSGSFQSVTTLPSYHSRQSAPTTPGSAHRTAFPVRALPALPRNRS